MSDQSTLLRVRYLEQVVNQVLSKKDIMSGKNKQKDPPEKNQGGNGSAPGANGTNHGADAGASDAPVERPWELAFKSTDIVDRRTRKLITITAEVLDADPDLLAHMLEKHPDAFSRLPAPPEETEE